MHELWDGCPRWSEELEQADEDKVAIRLMTCRRKRCRRLRKCVGDGLTPPICLGRFTARTAEETAIVTAVLRYMVKRSLAENEGDPEAERVAREARAAAEKRRKALAWERAKESLKRADAPRDHNA